MVLDIEKYLPYLDQYDWSREEKIKLLHTLWRMMEAQADKAFGISAVQLSHAQNKNKASQRQPDHLDSIDTFIKPACQKATNDHNPLNKGGQNAD